MSSEPETVPYGIIDPDYARIFTIARLLAWQEGYALAMHGSFTRDLDLIAVPWTDKACEPEHLVRRIIAACENLREQHSNPKSKPHGRQVWTLIFSAFGDPRFVDLSIFPIPQRDLAAANALAAGLREARMALECAMDYRKFMAHEDSSAITAAYNNLRALAKADAGSTAQPEGQG